MFGTSLVKETICQAGYLAYHGGIYSKHCGLFVDFDFQALLGQVDAITPHANRRLKSEDPILKCSETMLQNTTPANDLMLSP